MVAAITLSPDSCRTVSQFCIVSVNVSVQQVGLFSAYCAFQDERAEEDNGVVEVWVGPPIAVDVMPTTAALAKQRENWVEVFRGVDCDSSRHVGLNLRYRNVAVEFGQWQLCGPDNEPRDATRRIVSEVACLIHTCFPASPNT
jgi:hypothetical protein